MSVPRQPPDIVRAALSKRCVSCVPSVVALRKDELRKRELRPGPWRTFELRTGVLRCGVAYPQSPKDTLAGVFERMRRAARTKKFACLSERLALPPSSSVQAQAFKFQRPSFKRSTPSV